MIITNFTCVLLTGVCAENDAMSPGSRNRVTSSSNYGTLDNLKDVEAPRWGSNPEEDGDENPTVTINVSEEDAFIKELFINSSKNVDFITVFIVDEDGQEVHIHNPSCTA